MLGGGEGGQHLALETYNQPYNIINVHLFGKSFLFLPSVPYPSLVEFSLYLQKVLKQSLTCLHSQHNIRRFRRRPFHLPDVTLYCTEAESPVPSYPADGYQHG